MRRRQKRRRIVPCRRRVSPVLWRLPPVMRQSRRSSSSSAALSKGHAMRSRLPTSRLRTTVPVVAAATALLLGCRRETEQPTAAARESVTSLDADTVASTWLPLPAASTEYDTPPDLVGGLEAVQAALQDSLDARHAGRDGITIVQVRVDTSGAATVASVLRSAGDELDAEAVRVVESARFVPATKAGRPVAGTVTVPVRFPRPLPRSGS